MVALPKKYIPGYLWRAGVLYIPNDLCRIYEEYLHAIGKYEEARDTHVKNSELIGGASEEATIQYFTHRFLNSSVHVEYLVLDPRQEHGEISSDLLVSLSDGLVKVLDIPCGSGAGILSLFLTICELRSQGCCPKLPINVDITAGDVSNAALKIYNNILSEIVPICKRQGIEINWETHYWNAAELNTSAELTDHWFKQTNEIGEYIVLISLFSGYASENPSELQRSLEFISARLYNKKSTILCIEPKWSASHKYFSNITNLFEKVIKWFNLANSNVEHSEFKWFHPVKNSVVKRATLIVRKYSRT